MHNTIKKCIVVEAGRPKVWEALTDGTHLGQWFGSGQPTRIDPQVGSIVFDHGAHGDIPATIETFEPQQTFAFRWAVIGPAGTEPTASNSTVVRFELNDDDDDDEGEDGARSATRLTLVEEGFDAVDAPASELKQRYDANDIGWDRVLQGFADYVQG